MRLNFKSFILVFGLWSLVCGLLFLSGCATAPSVRPPLAPGVPGIYHRVEKGQTLWRISKMYNVDLDELVQINRISDITKVEVNQLIFIPHRQKKISVPIKGYSDDFIWPNRGRVISTFGQTFNNMINKGINIQPYNNLSVVASRSGKVVFYADNFGAFGKTIIIEHSDGFSTVYARNSQVFVKAGDSVQKGTAIAKIGQAGRDKNTYLYFEIRKGYLAQNPIFYLP
jgi:LysM repeat protein